MGLGKTLTVIALIATNRPGARLPATYTEEPPAAEAAAGGKGNGRGKGKGKAAASTAADAGAKGKGKGKAAAGRKRKVRYGVEAPGLGTGWGSGTWLAGQPRNTRAPCCHLHGGRRFAPVDEW